MVAASQLAPGQIVSFEKKLYRIESLEKISLKGVIQIKVKMQDIETGKSIEKKVKPAQAFEDPQLEEKKLEFLYSEKNDYIFLDIGDLEQVKVPQAVVGNKVSFLKEGVGVTATSSKNHVISVELPQFLELLVEDIQKSKGKNKEVRYAVLETGAKVEVPPFIEAGDIIKIDTRSSEYIQRV